MLVDIGGAWVDPMSVMVVRPGDDWRSGCQVELFGGGFVGSELPAEEVAGRINGQIQRDNEAFLAPATGEVE